MEFDIFKLHDDLIDIGNQSWICFYGPNLSEIIDELKKEHNLSDKQLARVIAKKVGCKSWTPEQVLWKKKKWIPIPLLNVLIEMSDSSDEFKRKIQEDVSLIKCNSATSKPIKAVKELSLDICKIAGAHAGDGNLHNTFGIEIKDRSLKDEILDDLKKDYPHSKIFKTRDRMRIKIKNVNPKLILSLLDKYKDITFWFTYGINVTEGYEDNLKAFSRWIKNVFDIEVKVKKHGTKKAWRVDFDNKIIARYFMRFFDFPADAKTYIVEEPRVIRNAPLEYRQAFLLGLMTFEGYTPCRQKGVGFSSKSKMLADSVYEIMIKSDIPVKQVKKDNYDRFICDSRTLYGEDLEKALNVFERDTEKWFRIKRSLERN